MIKTCNKCGELKEHALRNRKTGQFPQSQCKDCQKKYKDEHYQKNKEVYAERLVARRDSMKRFVNAIKSYPCTDCNLSWPPYVMHFDHLDADEKVGNISKMISDRNSYRLLIEEIMKCDVVCANCHAIRTHNRL